MREAFDGQDRDHSEEITLSAAMGVMMRNELDWRRQHEKKTPEGAHKIIAAADDALLELISASPDSDPPSLRELRGFKGIAPRLAVVKSTVGEGPRAPD